MRRVGLSSGYFVVVLCASLVAGGLLSVYSDDDVCTVPTSSGASSPPVSGSRTSSSSTSNGSTPCRYLIGFLPLLSLSMGHSKHFVGAVEYAVRRVNLDLFHSAAGGSCLLEYRTCDNKADTLQSLRAMTRLYVDGAVAFIGPEDTCATEARLAAAWNLPMIAFVSCTTIPTWKILHCCSG